MTRGGAINGNSFAQWKIEDSYFEGNIALQHGADIYLHFSETSLQILGSFFSRSLSNSIYSFQTGIRIEKSEFSEINLDGAYSAIACIECAHFVISQSKFKNLRLSSVIQTQELTRIEKTQEFTVVKNWFENIESQSNGGALRIINSDLDVNSNIFKNCSVVGEEGRGGAISVESARSTLISVVNNEFQRCSASRGGALFWNYNEPYLDSNKYSGNQVTSYGTDVASYGCKVQIISDQVGDELYNGPIIAIQTTGQDFVRIQDQKSGDELPQFYIAVLDNYDQVVTDIENGAVNVRSELIGPMTPGLDPEEIHNENTNTWHHGVFPFQEVGINAHPEHEFKISIYTTHVNPDLPASKTALTIANKTVPSVDIYAYIRPCASGQSYLNDGECLECPKGTYLIIPPTSQTDCLQCPSSAVCFGGNKIAPKPGYWRSGFNSLHFVNCFHPSSCIGSSSETYDPKGECAPGYKGVLCSSCEAGFTRNSSFTCNQCPPLGPNIALLIVVFIGLAAAFVIIIKCTLKSAKKKKSLFTVYFKILVNHLQVLMLIYSFELDWPREVASFLDTSRTVATAPEALFSFDCFLQSSIGEPLKRFYIYLILYFSLPLWGLLFAFLFWRLKYCHNTSAMVAKLVPTLLITFYLIHPSVTRSLLLAFNCFNIDGEMYLKEELSEVCWQDQHLIFALTIGSMGIALWSLGIPLFSWLLLYKNRANLYDLQVKERFGFLYNGYTERSYYWEAVISLRKFVIGFVAVLLTTKGTMLQSLVLFVILVFSILHTVKERPYVDYKVNQLEIISLLALMVTAYCGIFFLSDRNQQSFDFVEGRDLTLSYGERWLLFLSVFASNLLFMLMWLKLILIQINIATYKKCPRCYLRVCLRGRRERLLRASTFFNEYEQNTQKILLLQEIQQETQAIMNYYKKSKKLPRKSELETLIVKFRNELENLTVCNGICSSPFRKSRVVGGLHIETGKLKEKLGEDDCTDGCDDSAPSTRRGFFTSHEKKGSDQVHPSSLFQKNQNLRLLQQTWFHNSESQPEEPMRLESINSRKPEARSNEEQKREFGGIISTADEKNVEKKFAYHKQRRSFSSQNMSHVCITKHGKDLEESF